MNSSATVRSQFSNYLKAEGGHHFFVSDAEPSDEAVEVIRMKVAEMTEPEANLGV